MSPEPQGTTRLTAIERRSIDYVPERERHGRVSQQAPFWFLGNFQFFTIGIGFIGPGLGLSLGYTILAGTLGILFGTLFMAFHASQGPDLGLPQMVQSRAQFGYRGVIVPLFGTLFTYAAFNVVDTLLLSSGLNGIFGWNVTLVSVVVTVVALVLAIWGHDWLHVIFRVLFWISLPIVSVLTIAILTNAATWPAPAPPAAGAAPVALGWSLVAFATQFAASAAYNITYAPYVSDYTRYLPRETPTRAIVLSVFIGASASAIWLIAIGAWLAVTLNAADPLVALNDVGNAIYPGLGKVLAIDSVAALVATMGINAYSGMLTVVTGIDCFRSLPRTRAVRIVTTLALAVVWLGVALALDTGVVNALFVALTIMLYLLVPWTAVNLVDFFLVRRGQYAVTDLFTPDGIYGAWGLRGLVSYFAGFLAAVPFFVLQGYYTGPYAERLGGVDIAWLVGLVVSGGLYLLLSVTYRRSREADAVARSEAELQTLEVAPA